MAPTKSPVVRLLHIIAEAEAIKSALEGLSYEGFRESWLLRRAVEHGLLIISEAARTLPAEVKEAAADIALRKIETLGNFLRREYRDVDPELIWVSRKITCQPYWMLRVGSRNNCASPSRSDRCLITCHVHERSACRFPVQPPPLIRRLPREGPTSPP